VPPLPCTFVSAAYPRSALWPTKLMRPAAILMDDGVETVHIELDQCRCRQTLLLRALESFGQILKPTNRLLRQAPEQPPAVLIVLNFELQLHGRISGQPISGRGDRPQAPRCEPDHDHRLPPTMRTRSRSPSASNNANRRAASRLANTPPAKPCASSATQRLRASRRIVNFRSTRCPGIWSK
jgi:hypothetical protein